MPSCSNCGTGLQQKPSIATGMCGQCRMKANWQKCGGCGNSSVPPSGASCLVCHPMGVPVSSVGNTAPTQTSTRKVPFKVKCMDDGGIRGLVDGNTYTVVEEALNHDGDPIYRLDGLPGKGFLQSRFVVVEEVRTASAPTPTVDLSDWRVWRDHGLQPGECVCKMPRQQCDYHRGG